MPILFDQQYYSSQTSADSILLYSESEETWLTGDDTSCKPRRKNWAW